MPTYPQSATYRDDKGQTATVRFFVTAADEAAALTSAQAIVTALSALTNAAFDGARGAYTSVPAAHAYGANATFESVEDKAMLTFQTEVGSMHRYQVPAPKEAIMLADGETVNPANGLVAAFAAALGAGGASRDGVAISDYIGGIRIRRRFQRRFNIFTLNPLLTGPGE